MHYVLVICSAIVCFLGFMLYLLKKHEKLGKYENEVKSREISDKTFETIRKTHAHSATLIRAERNERMRKNDKPGA